MAIPVENKHAQLVWVCSRPYVQGINRLGKAAPKPGSLRPPDPNRRQDLDLFSEGAEQDPDYMRMVNDVWICRSCCLPCRMLIYIAQLQSNVDCRLKIHSRTRVVGCLEEEVGANDEPACNLFGNLKHLKLCSPSAYALLKRATLCSF